MKQILNELNSMYNGMDLKDITAYVNILKRNKSRVIVGIGAGRMGYSLRAHIMRLTHLGFKAFMIGDTNVPKIDDKSIVIINTSSGETSTNILYAHQAATAGSFIIAVTCNPKSTIAELADLVVTIPKIDSIQLMKTPYEQFTYLLFDQIAADLVDKMNLDVDVVSSNHSILE